MSQYRTPRQCASGTLTCRPLDTCNNITCFQTIRSCESYRYFVCIVIFSNTTFTFVQYLRQFIVYLFSSAQDSFIKFWDLRTQHCFATLTGHPGPVWDFALTRCDGLLVSGTNDQSLRVWQIKYVGLIHFP